MFETDTGFGCRIVKTESSAYGHTFGGEPGYRGTIPAGGSKAVHLLFRLNLRDSLMPIRLGDLQWLPLFYPFHYDACGMGYRVVSETEIKILMIETTTQSVSDFPYADYPDSFPLAPVDLAPISYDEVKALALREFRDRHSLFSKIRQEDQDVIRTLAAECTRIGLVQPLIQDWPRLKRCPDPLCMAHKEGWPQPVLFCTVWNEPIEGVDVWHADGEPIQILYQVCIDCGSILTHNQCT